MPQKIIEVGTVGALAPGTMTRVRVGGRPILLANVDGRICATDDTCTHEDASLSTGSLAGELVKCPLHGSRFNLCTGQVMDEPAEANLRTYRVLLDGDRILLDADLPDAG